MQHLLCAAAMLMYRKRHIARYYDNPQSPAGLPLPRALVHRLKCNNNDSCHFVSGLKCVRSTANDLWYFNALRKHLIRERVRESGRERIIHATLLVRLGGTQRCTGSGDQWCGDFTETEAVCVLTTRRPCRIQNQWKSEAKAVIKLIFGGGWDVFVVYLFPSFCHSAFVPYAFSSVKKNKIFTWILCRKRTVCLNC